VDFCKHRKQGKRWLWQPPLPYAYDPGSGKILAFHIGKRNNSACKALMKTLEKHIIAKAETTHIERRNRDSRTQLKRLSRETVCFSKER
jgi:IS1 family transposase